MAIAIERLAQGCEIRKRSSSEVVYTYQCFFHPLWFAETLANGLYPKLMMKVNHPPWVAFSHPTGDTKSGKTGVTSHIFFCSIMTRGRF